MVDINAAERLLAEMEIDAKDGKWSEKVNTKWHPEEGAFNKSAEDLANYLHRESDSLKQAVSRVTFYKNRGGSNLSDAEKGKLDHAIELLHKKEWK